MLSKLNVVLLILFLMLSWLVVFRAPLFWVFSDSFIYFPHREAKHATEAWTEEACFEIEFEKEKPQILQRPIPLAIFAEKLAHMHKDSGLLLQQEYEELDSTSAKLDEDNCSAATEEENVCKNRYVDVLPFDHNRVRLEVVGGGFASTDYINASYIQGFNSRREYIAAMGPVSPNEELERLRATSNSAHFSSKLATVADFLQMIHEQNVKVVIMLTECTEGSKVKCAQYWPAEINDSKKFKNYSVTLLSEEEMCNCTMRTLELSLDPNLASTSRHGQEPHLFTQFHYVSMKDHSTTDVINWCSFLSHVRSFVNLNSASNPVVVHCSAGIGRTGCFISSDCLLQQINSGAVAVDVFGCVLQLRQERARMVQNEDQYIFVYETVAQALRSGNRRKVSIRNLVQPVPRKQPTLQRLEQIPNGAKTRDSVDSHSEDDSDEEVTSKF